jgi:DNA repair photolyase
MAKINVHIPTDPAVSAPGLFPTLGGSEAPNMERSLGPLARRAAEAPLDSTGCLTEYRPLASRSIVSKVNSSRGLPFTYGINPYRGCEFACRYCYARYTHEFLEFSPEDFERKIYFKQNAGWLLKQELRRIKPGTQIALGTATDPYQPLERRQRVTRSILEAFAETNGLVLGLVTKSTLVARDAGLLKEIAQRHRLTVCLTVTTMDDRLARILEPRAPRPDLRMRTLERLRGEGIRAGVLCSPVMPGITDSRASLAAVARAAAAAGAKFFSAGALFLTPCSQPTFLRFVKENFPGQLAAYERRYGVSAFVSAEYRRRIADLVDAICREHRLGRRYAQEPASQPEQVAELQPRLPF